MPTNSKSPDKELSPAEVKEQLLIESLSKELKKLSLKGLRALIAVARDIKKAKEEEQKKKRLEEIEKAKKLLTAAGYIVKTRKEGKQR